MTLGGGQIEPQVEIKSFAGNIDGNWDLFGVFGWNLFNRNFWTKIAFLHETFQKNPFRII